MKRDIAFDFKTKTVTLNSGYRMPIYGIGTYSLTDSECIDSVTAALENGVRLIDTAYMYHNEESVGEAVRNSGIPREEIFVITKLYPNQFSDPESAIEDALKKIDIGYIDMMLLHHPGAGDVDAYLAMEKAVADGKIRSIGLSNWYVEELEEFLPQITVTPALIQNEIHPYYQENDVIPYIHDLGIVVQGWYPLGGRGHTAELLGNEVISKIADAHGTILLGFPIWHGKEPMLVRTFLEKHNLSGKTILPFCTSGGSGISGSMSGIRKYAKGAGVMQGKDLSGLSQAGIRGWLKKAGVI